MKRFLQKSVSALAMSALVMGGVVVSSVSLIASPAFAKNNNANNGNGNGNNGNGKANGNGATASSLGALNAAHANENAFLNASPNSRVGLIALYKAAVEATAAAGVAVTEAELALANHLASYASVYPTYDDYLAAVGTVTPPTAAETAYWDQVALLEGAIGTALGEVETLKGLEGDALDLAANKETNEEVISALWDLLGLEPVAE